LFGIDDPFAFAQRRDVSSPRVGVFELAEICEELQFIGDVHGFETLQEQAFRGRRETHGLPCRERPMAFTISSASLRKLNPQSNRFLAALSAPDFTLLAPHLRPVSLEHGAALHEAGNDIEHVYFPQSGMVSLVVVMRNGATVETATVGR